VYLGETHSDETIFNMVGSQNVVIDGGGTIMSNYDPNQQNCPPPCGITRAFRTLNAVNNITIRDLNITNLGSVLEVEGSGATNLTIVNVHGTNLSRYGSIRVIALQRPSRTAASTTRLSNIRFGCTSMGPPQTWCKSAVAGPTSPRRRASGSWKATV
jgi:hypothetical protein